jgi:hypothetical protein
MLCNSRGSPDDPLVSRAQKDGVTKLLSDQCSRKGINSVLSGFDPCSNVVTAPTSPLRLRTIHDKIRRNKEREEFIHAEASVTYHADERR